MMLRTLIFSSIFLAIGCGESEKMNACKQLNDEMCACNEAFCTPEGGDDSSGTDPTEEQLEACQTMLDTYVCQEPDADADDTGV